MINVRSTKQLCFQGDVCTFLFVAFLSVFVFFPSSSWACCFGCANSDCDAAVDRIDDWHDQIQEDTEREFDEDLIAYQRWWIEVLFNEEVLPAMGRMADQMSATAMFYTEMVGAFLDAQVQMDTQRLLRKLQFQAHKDYHPSDDFCWFGTNVKSLAGSESRGHFNSLALSQISLKRQIGNVFTAGARHAGDDQKVRWGRFVNTYCDIRDNNYQAPLTIPKANRGDTGLTLVCDVDHLTGAHRFNSDIDYTRVIDSPRTIDVDFTNDTMDTTNIFALPVFTDPGDEENVMALSQNLYGHDVLSRGFTDSVMKTETAHKLYLMLRSVAAKRSVAQATFNAIVGLKSSGERDGSLIVDGGALAVHPTGGIYIGENERTRKYLAAIVSQLLPADPNGAVPPQGGNILDLIGYMPSYYSQLEILAKRIYQNPTFYANLYDTPANVARKKVAMRAIELMVDRAMYESQLRREMSVSVLLATKMRETHRGTLRDSYLAEDE